MNCQSYRFKTITVLFQPWKIKRGKTAVVEIFLSRTDGELFVPLDFLVVKTAIQHELPFLRVNLKHAHI